jgi:mannose-1-phosphate guanylyltransferase
VRRFLVNQHLYAVIMAGGIGSRLWPRSRASSPKQFLDLVGPQTMLQDTVRRIAPLIPVERILLVVGEEHADTVLTQVPALLRENLVLEPEARGTAPCIGLAALVIQQRDPQAVMGVFPADHQIADAGRFREAISGAAQLARDGYLVTLGIAPFEANTGYGYIQRGAALGQKNGFEAYKVQRFTEKPDQANAQAFVESGEYYWNGGIFIWKAATILREIETHLPRLYRHLQTVSEAWGTGRRNQVLASAWRQVPRTTIDYGIMERASRVATIAVDIGWDDVGNWGNLSDLLEGDAQGNVIHGTGRTLLLDTAQSYVYASAGRLVAAVGLKDLVIVDTPDALLVCPKDRAQDVREVVQEIEEQSLDEYL